MTKKNESDYANCKPYFLNLTKKIGRTLRPWKLNEYINLMEQFRSQKIKGDKLLRCLLVLFKEYDDLSQLFKELMKEEIEELRKNEIQETLGRHLTNFFNNVLIIDPKIHEAALYGLGLYGEGEITLRDLKTIVVSILWDHEDLVGEFLEVFKDLTVATEEEAEREMRKEKEKKKKRKNSKNDDEEIEKGEIQEEHLHLLPRRHEIALKETEKPMKKRSVRRSEYTPKPSGPMRPLWKSVMRRRGRIVTSYNLFTKIIN